jgi:hypothetical protein
MGHLGRRPKAVAQREQEVLSARVKYQVYKDVETIAERYGLTLTQVVRKAVLALIATEKRAASGTAK